jgi:GNAT superfamily N-acetyltransferase|tara:strand:- start:355 stop:798 length:444 start_codon:yes stop_codon:yes gene_type:complete
MIKIIKTEEELIELHAVISEFYKLMPYKKKTLDPKEWATTWIQLIESGIGKVLALVEDNVIKGGIGLITHNSLEDGALVTTEAFWYVDEQSRGGGIKLFKAAEEYAESIGSERMMMIHLQNSMPEKVKKFYERMGFKKAETTYLKEL